MKTISIIGAGVGGLTSAIYLQNHGYQVTIYEKKQSTWWENGHYRRIRL